MGEERYLDAQGWAASECKRLAFAEVARVAEEACIPVLPVKGVLTAQLYYASPTERAMIDVDVRVRPRDLARLCAAGTANGWILLERSRAYASAAFEVLGERVEIEAHVGPPGFCRLTVDAMIARAVRCTAPFGMPHLQPELHDHAILLLVNAFKDQLVSASEGGLVDLGRMARQPELSFDVLAARAREAGIASMAWLVADWMMREREDGEFGALKEALGGRAPRPVYALAFRLLVRRGAEPSLALRALVRAGADTAGMTSQSFARTAAWWVETLVSSPNDAIGRVTNRRW